MTEGAVPSVIGDGSRPAATGPSVRCRIAPSPTGYLHVGNARTALFNWAFARHHGGTFILRVEDTDTARSTEEAIDILVASLRWLGLDWDEGVEVGGPHAPYRQMEGPERFAEVAARLLEAGRAYRCYCTPEELEDRRRGALKHGLTPGYDGRCRDLTSEEREAFEREGRTSAIRFAMSGRDVTVHDLIRGASTFPGADLKDFVILRSNGVPTYLLAAAVDDVRMRMTHVIRGEDLMPSTPRQLELIEALGAEPPAYAHLPLIVGPGGEKLSKRFHAVAVEHFRDEGFLPDALVNYLALLGWSKDATTTFVSRDELVSSFDVSHVSRSPAVFDLQKLEWMNGHYIRETPDAELAPRVAEFLEREGIEADAGTLLRAVPLIKERIHTLGGAGDAAVPVRRPGGPRREGRGHARPRPGRPAHGGREPAGGAPGVDRGGDPRHAADASGGAGTVVQAGVPAGARRDHRHARVAATVRIDGAPRPGAVAAATACGLPGGAGTARPRLPPRPPIRRRPGPGGPRRSAGARAVPSRPPRS